jgi:hypothetical protein
MKNSITAIIFGIAIITAAFLLGDAFINRNAKSKVLSITGLGETNFTSDLIVWEGSFQKQNTNLKLAYAALAEDKIAVQTYLLEKGIKPENMVFNAVQTRENKQSKYGSDGSYLGQEFLGYELSQSIKIESNDVAKIEKISREVTELLNKGVQFYSQAPRYYYTKLADLKIELIKKATEDARARAEMIASNSGASLGELSDASMGIFQITGQNSNEDYSWGGTFNTSDKDKTARITVKLAYEIK